jgi:DNA primase
MNTSIEHIAAEVAARLNLAVGTDRVWRGRCPACGYGKPTLEIKIENDRIAISCAACEAQTAVAAILGLPPDLIVAHPRPKASNIAGAIAAWEKAFPAAGTPAERYLRNRGITIPVPSCIRFLPRQRNWADGKTYPAMISLVARLPGHADPILPAGLDLLPSGAHFTFISGGNGDGPDRKAETEHCKLTLGQLRHGGVWLTPIEEIGKDLAVAEGIETALSVQQISALPTVAAVSAPGMRALRWPPQVRCLWIAADNDGVGRMAAKMLLERALRAGLKAHIKVPAAGKNDFNDVVTGGAR